MEDKVPVVAVWDSKAAPPTVFGTGVVWKRLTPLAETLDDPNEESIFHAPTVLEGEGGGVKKRKFGETFDRPIFNGIKDVPILDRFKRV